MKIDKEDWKEIFYGALLILIILIVNGLVIWGTVEIVKWAWYR